MKTLAEQYIESKKLAWSPSTIRSETYRLRAVDMKLVKDATKQYEHLASKLKPYALKTMFIRLTDFYEWMLEQGHASGHNIYRKFMKDNARLFKYAYKKEEVNVDFEDAIRRINKLQNPEVREAAIFYVKTGLRYFELAKVEDGHVVGKGGFRRAVLIPAGLRVPTLTASYSSFLQALKKVGLRPHVLRKVYANRLLRAGWTQADVMAALGWRSLQTVSSYQQSLSTEQLRQRAAELVA
jgi:integrase